MTQHKVDVKNNNKKENYSNKIHWIVRGFSSYGVDAKTNEGGRSIT